LLSKCNLYRYIVLIESPPARRCGVVKLLAATLWGLMRNDQNRAVMLGMTRMEANVMGPGQVVAAAAAFVAAGAAFVAAGAGALAGAGAPAEGGGGGGGSGQDLVDGAAAAAAPSSPPPPAPLAPQFLGERCLSVLIRVGHRLVARDFTDLAEEQGPDHVVGPPDVKALAKLLGGAVQV
jgi:hypothetical protein